ncbi:hypothetical protein CHUAL_002204 [Chamberlinius hualienensis]
MDRFAVLTLDTETFTDAVGLITLDSASANPNNPTLTFHQYSNGYYDPYTLIYGLQRHHAVHKECRPTTNDPDADCIPGIGGINYPILSQVPPFSEFDCVLQKFPGLYADPQYRCQVFHICDYNDRRKFSFICPNGTVLDQRVFVCNWWYSDFNCDDAPLYYHLNEWFYSPYVTHKDQQGQKQAPQPPRQQQQPNFEPKPQYTNKFAVNQHASHEIQFGHKINFDSQQTDVKTTHHQPLTDTNVNSAHIPIPRPLINPSPTFPNLSHPPRSTPAIPSSISSIDILPLTQPASTASLSSSSQFETSASIYLASLMTQSKLSFKPTDSQSSFAVYPQSTFSVLDTVTYSWQ